MAQVLPNRKTPDLQYLGAIYDTLSTTGSLTTLQAGEAHIGEVGGNTTNIRIAGATVAATGTYATGELVGTKLTLTNAMRISGGSGYLMSIIIEDLSKQSLALDIVIFDSNPTNTTFTDNSALDIDDLDLPKVLGVVSIAATDYFAFSDNSLGAKTLINLPVIASGSANLYACIVARSAPTYVANELSIKFGFERN